MSTKNSLLNFDLVRYDGKPSKCSICLDYINKKTKASCITECDHIFHISCIKSTQVHSKIGSGSRKCLSKKSRFLSTCVEVSNGYFFMQVAKSNGYFLFLNK